MTTRNGGLVVPKTATAFLRDFADLIAAQLQRPFMDFYVFVEKNEILKELKLVVKQSSHRPLFFTNLAMAVAHVSKFGFRPDVIGFDQKSSKQFPDTATFNRVLSKHSELKEIGVRLWDAGLVPSSDKDGIWKKDVGFWTRDTGALFRDKVFKVFFPTQKKQSRKSEPMSASLKRSAPRPDLDLGAQKKTKVEPPTSFSDDGLGDDLSSYLESPNKLELSLFAREIQHSGSWFFVQQFAGKPGLACMKASEFAHMPPFPRQALVDLKGFFFKHALHGMPKQSASCCLDKEDNLAVFLEFLDSLDAELDWEAAFKGMLELTLAMALVVDCKDFSFEKAGVDKKACLHPDVGMFLDFLQTCKQVQARNPSLCPVIDRAVGIMEPFLSPVMTLESLENMCKNSLGEKPFTQIFEHSKRYYERIVDDSLDLRVRFEVLYGEYHGMAGFCDE